MAINEVRNLSYGNTLLQLEITLGGVPLDINEVKDIEPISLRLDYPTLNRFTVGDTTITVADLEGRFAPDRSNNFFVSRSLPQDGTGVKVEIKAGYETHRITLFSGKILKVFFDSVVGEAEFVVTDSLHDLHRKQITDFGLDKRFRIVADDEESLNGFYPVASWVFPASEESVDVYKNTTEQLTEVPELKNRGQLNPDNFAVTSEGIETEGNTVQGAATGYPQIDFKAPFRHRKITEIVDDILDEVSITNKEVSLPEQTIPTDFSSNGRVGYQSIGTSQFGTSNEIQWLGYDTDWIQEGNIVYILRSPRRGDFTTRAALIQYNRATDVETVLYRAPASTTFTTEFWKIAKNGNTIAILATDSTVEPSTERDLPEISRPGEGSYDSTSSSSKSYIVYFDTSTSTATVRVSKTGSVKPQLGHYYIFGQTYGDFRSQNILTSVVPQSPPNMLPATSHNFMFRSDMLYFVCTTATQVGVARVGSTGNPTVVTAFPLDDFGNKGGLDFDIVGNTISVGVTYKEATRSRLVAYTETLT